MRRKDSEGHSYETRHVRTKDKGAVRLKDGTTGETNSETHAHTQTSIRQSPPASCLRVARLRASETICRLRPGFHTLECLCEELRDEDIEPYA